MVTWTEQIIVVLGHGVDVTKAKWSYVDWKYVVATYLLDY